MYGDENFGMDGISSSSRPTDNKGGGVLLYVVSSLNPSAFVPQTKYPEHVWCKLSTMNCEFFVGVCYRSNNTEIFGNDLHSTLRNLITEVSNKHVMLMGDFNYPSVNIIGSPVICRLSRRLLLDTACEDTNTSTGNTRSGYNK